MPRHDRAHGQWHTTRQKGAGHAGRRTGASLSADRSSYAERQAVRDVNIEELLAYVRAQDGAAKRRNGG